MSHLRKPDSSKEKVRKFRNFVLPRVSIERDLEEFFVALDTPVSLSCFLLFKYKEYRQLVEKDVVPSDYLDSTKFRDDYQAVSFLKKNRFLVTGINLREVALEKFSDAEEACRLTNCRFKNLAFDPSFKGPNVWLLNATRCKIAKILATTRDEDGILSDVTPQLVEEFFDSGAFGPGASTCVTGKVTTAERKFREECHITSNMYRFAKPFVEAAYPIWFQTGTWQKPEFRRFSKVITVPKNAKTDRTIAVEPGLNIWFQKALGRMLRRRLRKDGIDLNSSERNSRLAKIGSRDGSYATIDFSAASDTISKEVVREILPPLWYTLLDVCRTPSYRLGKEIREFEKFSSMGNGFTFELESLIFYAAASSVMEYVGASSSEISVFGDDVVLPSQAAALFIEFSKFLGFTVNQSKSYIDGLFRESCGAYWFNGFDVRPFFLKESPDNAERNYNFANGICDLAHRRNGCFGRDARFQTLHTNLCNHLPLEIRVRGNLTAGPGALHSNFDECCPDHAKNWVEGYYFPSFLFTAVGDYSEDLALLCARLTGKSDREEGNSSPIRRVTRIRFTRRMFVSQWYNFGPWIS